MSRPPGVLPRKSGFVSKEPRVIGVSDFDGVADDLYDDGDVSSLELTFEKTDGGKEVVGCGVGREID